MITQIRKLRADHQILPQRKIRAVFYVGQHEALFQEKKEVVERLAGIEDMEIAEKGSPLSESLKIFTRGVEIYLPLKDLMDPQKELEKVRKELFNKNSALQSVQQLLSNKKFVQNARADVVLNEKNKLVSLTETIQQLQDHEKQLEKMLSS